MRLFCRKITRFDSGGWNNQTSEAIVRRKYCLTKLTGRSDKFTQSAWRINWSKDGLKDDDFFCLYINSLEMHIHPWFHSRVFSRVPWEVWTESPAWHRVQIRLRVARELWKILKLKLVWRTIFLLLFKACTTPLRMSPRECGGTHLQPELGVPTDIRGFFLRYFLNFQLLLNGTVIAWKGIKK